MDSTTVVVIVVLVVGIGIGRRTSQRYPGRPYRPSWNASQLQIQQAQRIEAASGHYRDGMLQRAEAVLLSPNTDWTVITEAVATYPDPRARQIAALLYADGGVRSFVQELRRSNATDRETALRLLIRALNGENPMLAAPSALPALPPGRPEPPEEPEDAVP